LDRDQPARAIVIRKEEPESLWDCQGMIREANADIIVICNSWIKVLTRQATFAILSAGWRSRFYRHLFELLPLPNGRIQVKSRF
jgi:hypothetical protein